MTVGSGLNLGLATPASVQAQGPASAPIKDWAEPGADWGLPEVFGMSHRACWK